MTTAILVGCFSKASCPHAIALIEYISGSGYARVDEEFIISENWRPKD